MTPKNNNPETGQENTEDKMSLETEEYEHLIALFEGSQKTAEGENLPRSTVARLALLEENFARLCTVVGKLEQEIRLLKDGAQNEQL